MSKEVRQIGALAIVAKKGSRAKVALITSRGTGRWVIPKGWPIKGQSARKTSEIEAFEEAGLVGRAGKRPLGTYRYDKATPDQTLACTVTVYPFMIKKRLRAWPEKGQRKVRLCSFAKAAALVDDAELGGLILRTGSRLGAKPKANGTPKSGVALGGHSGLKCRETPQPGFPTALSDHDP